MTASVQRTVPEHIAIIMDGNGRWAKQHGLKRAEGHQAGAAKVIEIAECAFSAGVKYMTFYAFSTENWKRSPEEVAALISIFSRFMDDQLQTLLDKNISLRCIGQLEKFPYPLRRKLRNVMKETAGHTAGTITFALSYGSRAEITNAVTAIAEKVKSGAINPAKITEKTVAEHLYAPDIPDPDILIRPGGEFRVSNFLLWQIAYTELFVCDELWPEFTSEHLQEIIHAYQKRERRFGGRLT